MVRDFAATYPHCYVFGEHVLVLNHWIAKRNVPLSLVENNPKWDRKVCGLQVTDTNQSTIVVRALVSSTNPGKTFDLRCEVREGLIEFLRREHPESLPKVRNVDMSPDEETSRRNAGPAGTDLTSDKEHESGR